MDRLLIESRTVDSLSGLVEKYIKFRELYGPIVPPGVMYEEAAERMSKGDWSFLKDNWFFTFDDEVLYVPEKSALAKELKLPALIQVREDIKTGEIYIFSAPLTDGKAGKFTGLAALKAPEFMPYEKELPWERYLFDEMAPRRVIWEITLKPEGDAWMDLIKAGQASSLSESQAGMMMRFMSAPAEYTNNLWLCLEPQSEAINLLIYAPKGFTNRVEVYSCTDLISNVWEIAVQNLYPSGTNPAIWDANSEWTNRFLRAGNMDIDTDSDGINDAREKYVHQTNPDNSDSDNDALSDYQELYVDFTDPNYNDTSPPFVWITTPGAEERKAVLP